MLEYKLGLRIDTEIYTRNLILPAPDKAAQLAEVWGEVTSSIVEEMLARARPQMDELHIDCRG